MMTNNRVRWQIVILLIISSSYFLISLFFGYSLLDLTFLFLSLVILNLIVYEDEKENRRRIVALKLIYSLVFISYCFIKSFFVSKALLSDSFIYVLSSMYLLLPLIAIGKIEVKGRWGIRVLLTLLFSLFILLFFNRTINSYYYLYEEVRSYKEFMVYSYVLYFLITLFSILKLIPFKNSLMEIMLIITTLIIALITSYYEVTGYSLLDYKVIYLVLILIIYSGKREKDERKIESRRIDLTKLKDLDKKPQLKKEKPKNYEIPPNVPINDIK